ncbi:MAG TPA: dienelactone hydrolase family protein [Micropepsaceae bacterium]|nr:dienelactone hydrolase family protein [Micropepsaceae bacterium]
MKTRSISYDAGGKKLTGYAVEPATAGRFVPGILVCHQGGGLTEHAKLHARRLGELGYAAFALDMYGEVAQSREQAMSLLTNLRNDPPLWRARALAGLEVLKTLDGVDTERLGAIGYCFGGQTVLELTRSSTELSAVVAFHPGLNDFAVDDRPVTGRIMACLGADDPLITPEARNAFAAEMTRLKADWQMLVYGGAGHSFTDLSVDAFRIPGFAYQERAHRRSWAAMRDFFGEVFGS